MRRDHIIYIISSVLLLVFLILERRVLSPIYLPAIVIFLTVPYRKRTPFKHLWMASWFLIIIYILMKSGNLLIPFALSFAFALLFAPLVDYLETKKIPRVVSSIFFVLVILGFVALFLFLLIPLLFSQIQDLLTFLYNQIPHIAEVLSGLRQKLASIGIEIEDKEIVNRIVPEVIKFIKGLIAGAFNITRSIGTILQIVLYIVIVPILSLYMMLEWKKIISFLKGHVKKGSFWDRFLEKAIPMLSKYIRTQIILMILVGLIIGVPLYLLGVPYAILLGFFAGVMNIIPNIGYIMSLIPAILISFLSPNPWITIIKILSVYLVEQIIESYLLVPKLLGDVARLHPLVIITVLAFATYFSGVAGLVVAVPLAALIKIGMEVYREDIKKTSISKG